MWHLKWVHMYATACSDDDIIEPFPVLKGIAVAKGAENFAAAFQIARGKRHQIENCDTAGCQSPVAVAIKTRRT